MTAELGTPATRSGYDVVVIGGGVIGLALARRLAGRGARVAVLDRDRVGALASRASAGMLAPQPEAEAPDAFLELGLRARAAYRSFAGELEAETGRALDYREDGLLALSFSVDAETELARRSEWQRAAGLRVEELAPVEGLRRWPALELPVGGGREDAARFGEGRLFWFPDEAQVDAPRLVEALVESCRGRGVDLLLAAEAIGFARDGRRVRGVLLRDREIPGEIVVNAAGAWAGHVAAWLGETLPVEPVRGQMIAFRTAARPPRPIVAAEDAYSLIRTDGRLLVGATVERVGYESSTTAAGQRWLEARAAALAPESMGVVPDSRWAGLRPGTPDGRPILGFSAEAPNVYHAAGHYRNGILLAHATAELVCGALEGDRAAVAAAEPFSPARFGEVVGARE